MKYALATIAILAALAFSVMVRRMEKTQPPSFPARDPLPPGMTNPPLRRIGTNVPPEGSRVWFATNCQHDFTILDASDPEVFQVQFRDGLRSTVAASHISHLYIEATE